MFWEIVDRAETADITVEGVYLRKFEPDAEFKKAVEAQASRWALAETTVELNRHICYNHLTDYGWTRLLPVNDIVTENGRFCGALLTVEDEYEFGGGIRRSASFGLLLTDGRSLGRTASEFLYSASLYGRSTEREYELVSRDEPEEA